MMEDMAAAGRGVVRGLTVGVEASVGAVFDVPVQELHTEQSIQVVPGSQAISSAPLYLAGLIDQ